MSVRPVSGLLVAAALLFPYPAVAQTEERQVLVTVTDRAGAPVPGLAASDFIVREGGIAREVLRVARATEPAHIALLVDTSQAINSDLVEYRRAVRGFLSRLEGKHEVALIEFGERPSVLVDYTRDTKRLDEAAGRLFPRMGSGTYLLDAIVDAAGELERRKAARPVIVIIAARGPEFSERHHNGVLEALRESGAALHSFVLARTGTGGTTVVVGGDDKRSAQELEIVLAEGTKLTGGRREDLVSAMGFADRLAALATELNNQYVVTYGRPKTLIPPDTLEVSVKRPELTARARRVP